MARPRVELNNEDHLLDRAADGDRDAFAVLVDAYQHEVYTLAMRLVRDSHLASDVTQEAFIRAWRGLPKFRRDAAFGTWLHRITANVAWTQRHKRIRRQTALLEEHAPIPDLRPLVNPEHHAANIELRGALREALFSLPEDQRIVVTLKDIYGWTHGEIADRLQISVSAAKVRLHRAHVKLRKLLGEA